jgi:hypothetical protein
LENIPSGNPVDGVITNGTQRASIEVTLNTIARKSTKEKKNKNNLKYRKKSFDFIRIFFNFVQYLEVIYVNRFFPWTRQKSS